MRQAHHSADFEPSVTARRSSLIFAGVCATFVLACSHLVAFALGDWHGAKNTIAAAEEIVKTNARRATPAPNPPVQLLKCDKEGREEFLRTCRARVRSGSVGAR